MDIVIIADFCGPLDGTYNSRFLYLAEMLVKKHNVEIITSDFNHANKDYFKNEIEKHDFSITMLHEGFYPKNICLKRFWGHYIWGVNVKKYLKHRQKPDVIFTAVPTLKAAYEAAKYCEKNKIRFIVDVQDLWPEAFQMVLNIPVLSSVLFFPFRCMANGIYKRADAVCAVSDTYCKRVMSVNYKAKDVVTVFLGTELDTFDMYANQEPIIKKNENEIWIAYCGTLGNSYDITCVIDALRLINNKGIRFVVMGDGPRREEFEKYAEKCNVNTTFTGRLNYSDMCNLLCVCDITINPITHLAAQSIINKHADYAASGLPVISTQENEEYRKLVESYHMGYNCNNNDAIDLANKIQKLIIDKELRLQMGRNARTCAEECFDRKLTYKKICDILYGEMKNE